jgi:predicted DNA binding protein
MAKHPGRETKASYALKYDRTRPSSYGRELVIPSNVENEEIHVAALTDPNAQPWTDEQLEAVRLATRFGYGGKT